MDLVSRAEAKARGLKTYFTGLPCVRGHLAPRQVSNSGCTVCLRARVKSWRALQPKITMEKPRQTYEERIAYNREWRRLNPDKSRAHGKRWRSNNIEKRNEARRRRQAAEISRTPKWIKPEDLLPAYQEARRLTVETAIPHHVDHIVPLQGETVSGLHVPWNLQILTAAKNVAKGNSFV